MNITLIKVARFTFALVTCIFSFVAFAGDSDLGDAMSRTVKISGDKGWGHGLRIDQTHILTAAHVIDMEPNYQFEITNANSIKLGTARLLKIGNRLGVDLALLEFVPTEPFYANIRTPVKVCQKNATPGEELAVAFENTVQRTHASLESGFTVHEKGQVYSHATEAFFSRGVSGAGVYNVQPYCLAGVISKYEENSTSPTGSCIGLNYSGRQITTACASEFGTVFVTADDIANFLK